MKIWYFLVLAAILLVSVGYIYVHRHELRLTASIDPIADGTSLDPCARPPIIAWEKVDRSPDGFKVEMPANIKQIQIPAYSESGGSEQAEMIFSNPSAETSFSVSWADNPPVARVNRQISDRTLDMARDNALARTQTTLTGESKATLQGFPTREFAARNAGGGILNSRLIFAGSRLYMLTAAFPSASARREDDVKRFFNSFSITSTATGGGSAQTF